MLNRYKLSRKFTLFMLAVLLVGILVSAITLFVVLEQRAEEEVKTRGLVLIETMNAVRDYTSLQVNPLLQEQLQTETTFIPETVPGYSAREVFENFRADPAYANFLYVEATLNPTNPRDLADDFEMGLIQDFRADESLTQVSGFRELFGEQVFYIARPLRVSDESCLACHGDPADAPASLINSYGDQNGFGWELGEIQTAQVVYVPASDVFETTRLSLTAVLLIFVVIFGLGILLINSLLRYNVILPVTGVSSVAEKVTAGSITPQDLESENLANYAGRGDEIGLLARIFQQMAGEVIRREQQLKDQVRQLRVEIDEAKRSQEVKAITSTDYFQDLQAKAKYMRQRRQRNEQNKSDTDNT